MGAFWSPAPVVVAGPCVLESEELNLSIAEHLADLAARLAIMIIFKASFDKANRVSLTAHRGPGIERGIEALRQVRSETGLPVITDVHEAWQAERVAPAVDALQVPAFLCRQTDLLTAAGGTGLPVNIKRGQWMPPESMRGAVDKVRGAGSTDVVVTERGTFFGYGDLVVDMRNFSRIRDATGVPVLFDATHSVQQPGKGPDGSSGGKRSYVPDLLLAAIGAGADGLFVETHPAPMEAPSDGAVMWPLDALEAVLARALEIWHIRQRPVET
jgi:2-dehydro-3-deoxyphosphooctonate aldolase (KDO 8-P synthase)